MPSGNQTTFTSHAGLSVLVAIPCLNEEMTVGEVIRNIPRNIPGVSRVEVLVVDDGSTDGTARIAAENGAQVVKHRCNLGLGTAMRSALRFARLGDYDILATIDGDGQFNPANIPDIVAPIVNGVADMVTASRFADPALAPEMPGIKCWGNARIAELISFLVGKKLFDVSCGFRAYSRQLVRALTLSGNFTYTHETILQAAYKRFRIVEVPMSVRGVREFGQSRVANNLWRYGKQCLSIIVNCVFHFRPFAAFGCVALGFATVATGLALFFFGHWMVTGMFEPHLWAGFLSAFLYGISTMTLLFCLIAVMFNRMQTATEQETAILLDCIEALGRRLDKGAQGSRVADGDVK